MRVAVVNFLNAAPLWWGLAHNGPDHWSLLFLDPAQCAQALTDGKVDLALVPTMAYLNEGFSRVGDLGVASRGAVESVLLFSKCPLADIHTCRIDPASRTSAMVLRWLLPRAGSRGIEWIHEPNSSPLENVDAALVIGDPALQFGETLSPDIRVSDLGKWWKKETGLPLVFALWAARDPFPEAIPILRESLTFGQKSLPTLAHRWSHALGIPEARLQSYLSQSLTHRFAAPEEEGLTRLATLHEELS